MVDVELHVVRVEALVGDRGLRARRLVRGQGRRRGRGHARAVLGEVGRHGLRGGGGGDCGGGLGERLLRCIGIDDDDMALLEVVDECVEVGQVQPATCVVAALGAG